jgi:hypothetical protein
MCDNCTSHRELCILRSRVACRICNQSKVRCLFLDGKHKCKDEVVVSEDEELALKKAMVGSSKPLGSKPTVVIPVGPSRTSGPQLSTETVELLRELVDGIQDLSKVAQGLTMTRLILYVVNFILLSTIAQQVAGLSSIFKRF